MDLKKITNGMSARGQCHPRGVTTLARKGFRAIVCNRPEGDAADQPSHAEIASAAADAGLGLLYLPVTLGIVKDETAQQCQAAQRELQLLRL
ncbi:MAG: sulfur transferase domain-containing protein [Pacificibacter sp.]|jgi:sulfide:quinone oxidoreductase|uniref:beta-lactamase hydrolase domain-containing protein n=1 Tax=Pacificibacter sp. TaxID=1917866 RepID=UPI00321BDFB5